MMNNNKQAAVFNDKSTAANNGGTLVVQKGIAIYDGYGKPIPKPKDITALYSRL